jgi:16S rRNA (guanine527-N7)-methyltransferase
MKLPADLISPELILTGADPSSELPESPASGSTVDAGASESDVALLLAAVAKCGLTIPEDSAGLLAQYCRVMWDWNTRLNLTRHTDWDLFVTRDLLDTIELAKHLPANSKVMDIGSGGGVPGIPLAIIRPDLQVKLCDSVGKKAMALKDIVHSLSLPIHVYSNRAEVILRSKQFDFVTARAVASIDKLMTWLKPVWRSVGQLLLIKGPKWSDEYAEAVEAGHFRSFRLDQISSWSTPGRDGQSVLLHVTRAKAAKPKQAEEPG